MKNQESHEPVMVSEVFEYLHINKNSKVIDATLGLAGHTIQIVKRGALVLGIEADLDTLEIAEKLLKNACPGEYRKVPTPFKLIHGNFKDIEKIAKKNGFPEVDGILADLGVSSYQLTSAVRGMSFQNPLAELDMRIDSTNLIKAKDLLNLLRKDQLMDLFQKTLSYKDARHTTEAILAFREKGRKFEKVSDFISVLPQIRKGKLNPYTLPFLALRIATNSEIVNLAEFLTGSVGLLKHGASLVVISFHSGEDRVVKKAFSDFYSKGIGESVNKDPLTPSVYEIAKNPRSRSAKMRVFKKY